MRKNTEDDLLLPDRLAPLLEGTIFSRHIHHFLKVSSTNTVAAQAAAAGEQEGAVFLAEEQESGRGRGAHAWHSPPSQGIYLSVLLRPEWKADAKGEEGGAAFHKTLLLSLAAGLAAQAAIAEVTGGCPDLRWPNDLLLNGKKCGGILAELSSEGMKVRSAVLGVGINVNQEEFPPELKTVATSLRRESGRAWPRLALTAALLKSLDCEYRLLLGEQRDQILRRFEQSSSYARGKQVRVDEGGGYEGITDGLDEQGFLMVRSAAGPRRVISGGVRDLE